MKIIDHFQMVTPNNLEFSYKTVSDIFTESLYNEGNKYGYGGNIRVILDLCINDCNKCKYNINNSCDCNKIIKDYIDTRISDEDKGTEYKVETPIGYSYDNISEVFKSLISYIEENKITYGD